jgi:hypothetical protein
MPKCINCGKQTTTQLLKDDEPYLVYMCNEHIEAYYRLNPPPSVIETLELTEEEEEREYFRTIMNRKD